jgi:hypothetical protein
VYKLLNTPRNIKIPNSYSDIRKYSNIQNPLIKLLIRTFVRITARTQAFGHFPFEIIRVLRLACGFHEKLRAFAVRCILDQGITHSLFPALRIRRASCNTEICTGNADSCVISKDPDCYSDDVLPFLPAASPPSVAIS